MKTKEELFVEIEENNKKDIADRSIDSLVPLRDVFEYSLFCKRYIRDVDFKKFLDLFAKRNFLAHYHMKHDSLRGSGIVAWDCDAIAGGQHDVDYLDHAIYTLENVQLDDYDWFSRKYPLRQQHNHLERKTQIKKMIEVNQAQKSYIYPPIIGYRYGDEIYVLEGTRRISSILLDETQSIKDVDIFIVDILYDGQKTKSKNLYSYISESSNQNAMQNYQNQKIRNDPHANYYFFDYAQKREFLYPDLGQQISAIIKYIMTNDKTDVSVIWEEINKIKNDYPK